MDLLQKVWLGRELEQGEAGTVGGKNLKGLNRPIWRELTSLSGSPVRC